jgi:hypothetical protein
MRGEKKFEQVNKPWEILLILLIMFIRNFIHCKVFRGKLILFEIFFFC